MAILGIDHPLIAVRDINKAIEVYRDLGFFIAAPGQHPWGTSTALALFHHQILEIVSIGDPSLLDGYAAGEFRFGRHVEGFLNRSEGVALTALFTEDAEKTEIQLKSRGIPCTGTVNFGRDVVRVDGKPDRTKTTLKIYHNETMPRLSVFACQQHRRDLLEFPDRMTHPNGASGFASVTIVAESSSHPLDWLTRIHGVDANANIVNTTNGDWRVMEPQQFEALYGTTLPSDYLEDGPRIAALNVRVRDLNVVKECSTFDAFHEIDGTLVANDMASLGGVSIGFVQA